MKESADCREAVILGSGIGGLSLGIFLLLAGYNVTIVEKNRQAGGLMRSYSRKGFDCPVGIHYIGSLAEGQALRRIFDVMGVYNPAHYERMDDQGTIDRYIFGDFTFNVPEGFDAFEQNLRSALPGDSGPISHIMKDIRFTADRFHSLDFIFSRELDPVFFQLLAPLSTRFRELECSLGLRRILAVTCGWMGVPAPECPLILHHMTLASYLFSAWRLTCTGADLADTFVSRFRELGGTLILGDAVQEILSESRIVRGIRLASGLTISAPLVVSSLHPQTTLGLVTPGEVKPVVRKRIERLENTDGIFSAQYSVRADIHPAVRHNVFLVESDEEGTMKDTVFIQVRKTPDPAVNSLHLLGGTTNEEWKKWEDSVTGRRGREYGEEKARKSDGLLKKAASLLGDLSDAKYIDSYTPLTIRDWIASPGGSAYGIKKSASQLASSAMLNRALVRGLYLAGQSVQAPGIVGTVLGSLGVLKQILGPEVFFKEYSRLRA